MSGDIRVGRKAEDYAPHTRMGPNAVLQGFWQRAKVHFLDDFLVDTMDTDAWAASVGNGGNDPAIVAGANGICNIATNASASDVTEMYGAAVWYPRQHITIEARLQIPTITTVAVAFGLVNAPSNTNDKIAFAIGGSDAISIGTNVTDAACFVFDTGADTDKWFCLSTVGGAAAEGGNSLASTAPVAGTYEVQRIDIDTSGNATFYRNGVAVYHIVTAVAAANALSPYFAVLTRTTAARTLFVDYVEIWQNRRETSSVIW